MIMLNIVVPDFWMNIANAVVALYHDNTEEWNHYNNLVFPTQAKCHFRTYGPFQSCRCHEAHCQLPMNALFQKVFIITSCWLIAQLVISVLNLGYYLAMFSSKYIRISILCRYIKAETSYDQVSKVVDGRNFGDFFILKQIARHIDAGKFSEIISRLSAITKNIEIDTFAPSECERQNNCNHNS